jgi:DMSO/TMAO reductase YedYZ molybdopterin-dependent catalytic subunit
MVRAPRRLSEQFWPSPLRSLRLTSVLGLIVLAGALVVAVTGFLSHAAYNPALGRNGIVPGAPPLVFDWPTRPVWLYSLTQGLHVVIGFATIPLILAKLWSVLPRLFVWPPVRGPAHALERLSLLALVGSTVFQFATGVMNVQLYYPWHFNFVVAHYYGAWVFTVALLVHAGARLPTVRQAMREREAVIAPTTISRRGLLALAGGASVALAATMAGQTLGGPLRRLALLAPRAGDDFPVNKTAAVAKVPRVGADWRLVLAGASLVELTRAQLESLPVTEATLPIACVEGWSTRQHWAGVRLRDLAAACGVTGDATCHVESLQPRGAFRQTTLSADQVADPRSLLALRVNGADLSLDHGYPARIIVPALPGVHCTKWIARLTFTAA